MAKLFFIQDDIYIEDASEYEARINDIKYYYHIAENSLERRVDISRDVIKLTNSIKNIDFLTYHKQIDRDEILELHEDVRTVVHNHKNQIRTTTRWFRWIIMLVVWLVYMPLIYMKSGRIQVFIVAGSIMLILFSMNLKYLIRSLYDSNVLYGCSLFQVLYKANHTYIIRIQPEYRNNRIRWHNREFLLN